MMFRLLLFLTLILSAGISYGQSNDNSISEYGFSPTVGISLSYSPVSFRAWGTMQNTRSYYSTIEMRHTRLGGTGSFPTIDIGSELIVAGYIRYPEDGVNGTRESVYGFGLTPIRLDIPLRDSLSRPFLTSSAGFMMTNRDFPDDRGARINYLLDIGIGWQLSVGDTRLLQFGYKLHHFSNGNQGSENPGIDSHMFFVNLHFQL